MLVGAKATISCSARGRLGETCQRALDVVPDPEERMRERRHVERDSHCARFVEEAIEVRAEHPRVGVRAARDLGRDGRGVDRVDDPALASCPGPEPRAPAGALARTGRTCTRPTIRPFERATTVCGSTKRLGSLDSRTVSAPGRQRRRVYVTVSPDQVSFGYSPSTRTAETSGRVHAPERDAPPLVRCQRLRRPARTRSPRGGTGRARARRREASPRPFADRSALRVSGSPPGVGFVT